MTPRSTPLFHSKNRTRRNPGMPRIRVALRTGIYHNLLCNVRAVLLQPALAVLSGKVRRGALRGAAVRELQLREPAHLHGAVVGLGQIAARDAHVGGGAEQKDGRGVVGSVDVADENRAEELHAGRVDAGEAAGGEI